MERLQAERRWCVWKSVQRGTIISKPPFVSATQGGQSNHPETWLSFTEAQNLLFSDAFEGLGFFLSKVTGVPDHALCVIDIDAHHNTAGQNPLAAEILEHFKDTYIETSPSGRGYHIICTVDLSQIPLDDNGRLAFYNRNTTNELEIYIGGLTNRYMTYTGNKISTSDEVTDQTANVLGFLEAYMKRPEQIRAERIGEMPLPQSQFRCRM